MSTVDGKPTPSRQERIVILLENYQDVEAGLRDRRGTGEHIPLMSACWNHPSYVELDRLLGAMKDERRHLYWHLAETYFRSSHRRVLQCPRCRGIVPTWHSANFHKHGHSNVAVVPRVVRVIHESVEERMVDEAVAWLDEQWGLPNGIDLPDELVHLAA